MTINKNHNFPITLNKDNISGKDDTNTIIKGDPQSFFGTGLVVFIDLLGFSKEILTKWSEEEGSPLKRLFKIKNSYPVLSSAKHIKFGSYSIDNNSNPIYHHYYQCRVQTVSDSIVLSTALPPNLNPEDFMLAFLAIANASFDIWREAIMEGFTIRGGFELDDIFWNSSEIVGPAFIKAFELEKDLADTSRIIIGERLLVTILFVWKNAQRLKYNIDVEDAILTLLMKSSDNYVSLKPNYMLNRKNVSAQNIIKKVRILQEACKIDGHKRKYEELISVLSNPEKHNKPNKQDLLNYQSLLVSYKKKVND